MRDCCARHEYDWQRPKGCPECGKPLPASFFAEELQRAVVRRPTARDREPSWSDRDDDYFEGREPGLGNVS